MDFKIKQVDSGGKVGTIHLEIGKRDLCWEWELGSGEYVAFVNVPNSKVWMEMFGGDASDRNKTLEEIAKELGKIKCPSCKYKIDENEIIFKSK